MRMRGAKAAEPSSGERLYREVEEYDALGEHRVSGPGDTAATAWLSRKMSAAGLTVSRQSFPYPLYEPTTCTLTVDAQTVTTFPGWMPVMTPVGGIAAPLAPLGAGDPAGKIAVMDYAYGRAPGWAAPGPGKAVEDALEQGALAAVVITEGPTGDVIALNADAAGLSWKKPVVIAAGRDGAALKAAADGGRKAVLVNRGRLNAAAKADNVIGRRKGSGNTVVVTTPKSGWFHCAGERGTGIALFLELARWLVHETDCDLLFGSSSAHEIGYLGSAYFHKRYAPPADRVRLWLHIGANAAVQATTIGADGVKFLGKPAMGRLTASPQLVASAETAFHGLPGYEKPVVFSAGTAVGELEVFQKGGYGAVVGLLGAWSLFHTEDDRARVATTPDILEAVDGALKAFLRSQL